MSLRIPPALELPMLNLLLLSMVIASLNPSPGAPITFSAGTGVSSKLTSQAGKKQILKTQITVYMNC